MSSPSFYTPIIPPVDLPEGKSGEWSIEKFTVSQAAANGEILRMMFSNFAGGRGCIKPGTYTRLCCAGDVIMSDTPDEIRDHKGAVWAAHGHCLVLGLGLGMVVVAMLENPDVTKVTVVELSPDVIALTGPTLKARYGDRLAIIEADATTWKPPTGARYGCVWADIWPDISDLNLPQMRTFSRRYSRCADWYGNWAEELCKDMGRRIKEAQARAALARAHGLRA